MSGYIAKNIYNLTFIKLIVFTSIPVPSVKILGDREVHVNSGTLVTVRCLISNVLDVPSYVFWHHEGTRLLDGDSKVSIVTQRVVGEGAAVSTLTLTNPTPKQSGIYTCRPENLDPASVRLHVIRGKERRIIRFMAKGGSKIESFNLRPALGKFLRLYILRMASP